MKSERKLVAIMFTDIVGYTMMMGKDSNKTLEFLRMNRHNQKLLVEKHNGSFLKEMGDGTMASFQSALDAVLCAVEIQESLTKEDYKLRIGIHSGDIVAEEGEIYGDGINIASRIQSVCDPGGIYITEPVHKAIRGSDVPVKYLGELQLKNVDYPVKTYAIQSTGLPSPKINYKSTRKTRLFRLLTATTFLAVAIIAFLIFKNPGSNYNVVSDINTKSLVVLPLDNLSNDPSQNYFSDGMTEDITTKLCKISDLKITSRTSAMQYKKATKSLREIGSELGVNYIVEGSLRRIRDSLRISIQLIDAINDIHLWAEEYNRPFEDIFSLHSEIAAHIASHLKAEISPNEMKLLTQKPTDIIRAYDIYYKGQAAYNQYLSRYDQIDLENAEVFYRQALDLDANLAPALVGLAKCYVQRVNIFYDIQLLDSGLIMANNALANDTDFSEAYLVKGRILAMQGQNEESQKALNTAISLNPNGVSTMDILTYFAQLERRYDKALLYQLQAAELDPLTPSRHVSLALAYQDLDYFEKAEESVQNALQLQPDLVDAYTQWAF
ncbi:MAG TPA: adenylate/guanylate cyclase domain-containing protein, partial [Candidatus Dojkabacteria bacterium]